ncbi:MAG: tetratricopeptide repeat-containing sensor histidine kinase [Bernardetiaceae bacterium]|nr:tetratricopeptide repeat-containing sensor histidine kinase [Bernardetiaceae bacterium]
MKIHICKYYNYFILLFLLLILPLGVILKAQPVSTFEDIPTLRQLIIAPQSDSLAAQYYSQLAWHYRSTKADSAYYYGTKALGHAEAGSVLALLPRIYSFIGLSRRTVGDYSTAASYYLKAQDAAININAPSELAYARNNLSSIYRLQGNYNRAAQYAYLAKRDFIISKDSVGLAYALKNIAHVLKKKNNYKKARKELFIALDIWQKRKYVRGIPASYNAIGETYLLEKKYDSASYYFYIGLGLDEANNDAYGIANAYKYIGALHQEKANFDSAFYFYQKARDIEAENNFRALVLNTDLQIAKLHIEAKNYEQALDIAQEALKEAKALQSHEAMHELRMIIANAYAAIGQYQKAYQYVITYKKEGDSLYNHNLEQNINAIEKLYESELKMQKLLEDNKKDNQKLDYQKQEIFYKNLLILIFVIVLLFLIGFIFFYFKTLKRLKAAYQVQKEQKQELEKLNQIKDKLFSLISHDLRAPFNSIKGGLFLLKDDKNMSLKERDQLYELLWIRIGHADELLNNLLNWARTQIEGNPVDLVSFNLKEAIEDAKHILLYAAEAKNITINTDNIDNINLHTDPEIIRLSLRNLLSNAIKFTPPGGEVSIFTTVSDNSIRIGVKDNGIGIPEGKQKRLLDALTLESTPGTNNEKGTGLGLMITLTFLHKINAKLAFESTENKGSTFYISVPMQANK